MCPEMTQKPAAKKQTDDAPGPPHQGAFANRHEHLQIARLRETIAERDAKIADLRDLVMVLGAAVGGLILLSLWVGLVQ